MTPRSTYVTRQPRPLGAPPEDSITALAKTIARILAREHHETAEAEKKAAETASPQFIK
jgi:hypothetical protein